MTVEFDNNIPPRDPGLWGLKINGGPVTEARWFERKPCLCHFSSIRPKAFESDPYPGVESIEVVKISVTEIGEPQLLAETWFRD